MKFLSICSGIEAASAAWEPLGWQAVGFSEIDKFASAVLAHRHPSVPNFGDMLGYRSWDVPPFDILVGGPPCQAFSVSGLQHGLDDPRGQLSLTYCDLADHFDPAFTLWENVPGVLSNRTNPFGCLLGRLCGADAPLLPESGHVWPGAGILSGPKRTLAWRTLDAQYFGLAQRRKRVFLLASRGSGNWTGAAALFPVSEGVPGNTPPCRGTGQSVTGTLAARTGAGGGFGTDFDCDGGLVVANCLTAREGKGPDSDATTTLIFDTTQITSPGNVSNLKPGDPCHPLAAEAHPPVVCFEPRYYTRGMGGAPSDAAQVASTLTATNTSKRGDAAPCVAFQVSQSGVRTGSVHATLDANNGPRRHCGAFDGAHVRRLTPRECERLMGLPDDHTLIPFGRKPAADAPRYKAIGNSMAVNVMRWLGERILFAQSILPPCSCGTVKLGAPPLCPICD